MPPRVPDPAPTPAAGRPNTLGDDILKRLAEHEAEGRVDDLDSLAGILEAPREQLACSLEQLVHNGWVERTGPHYAPTDAGRARRRPRRREAPTAARASTPSGVRRRAKRLRPSMASIIVAPNGPRSGSADASPRRPARSA